MEWKKGSEGRHLYWSWREDNRNRGFVFLKIKDDSRDWSTSLLSCLFAYQFGGSYRESKSKMTQGHSKRFEFLLLKIRLGFPSLKKGRSRDGNEPEAG